MIFASSKKSQAARTAIALVVYVLPITDAFKQNDSSHCSRWSPDPVCPKQKTVDIPELNAKPNDEKSVKELTKSDVGSVYTIGDKWADLSVHLVVVVLS